MEYRERKEVTPEAAVILWQASRLDLSEDYERAPEIFFTTLYYLLIFSEIA